VLRIRSGSVGASDVAGQVKGHESTATNSTGEDKFESYRRLGEEIARRTFELVKEEKNFATIAGKLLKICSPTLDNAGRFARHSSRLMDLWSQLGEHPNFQILHQDFEELATRWPDDGSSESFRTAVLHL
jgi:hypothetical protein